MTLLSYPSAQLPGGHGFEFEMPEGWQAHAVPGALAVVRAPTEVEGFVTNVVVSSRRISRAVDLRVLVLQSLATAKQRGGNPKMELQKVGHFAGRPTYVQALSLDLGDPPRRMAQVMAFFLGPTDDDAEVADLYTIVGTTPDSQSATAARDILGAVGSFRFTGALHT